MTTAMAKPADDVRTTRVAVVIPALNEEASLPLVLRDLPPVEQVVVCDNRSTDGTAAVAREAGAVVVHEPERGYGAACLRALAEIDSQVASGLPAPEIVVFVDADYSDHPDRLSDLTTPIACGEADFVLGSRMLGRREPGAMPPQSLYGNQFACWLMKILFGAAYTDLGPFRAIRYESLNRLQMEDRNFGWTIEMQLKALQQRLQYCEVPVPYRRRVGVSKISGTLTGTIRAGWKILFLIAKYGLLRPRRSESESSHGETTAPDLRSMTAADAPEVRHSA